MKHCQRDGSFLYWRQGVYLRGMSPDSAGVLIRVHFRYFAAHQELLRHIQPCGTR